MSFRELRNFTEILRILGFPRLVSIQSFRTPNFPLVAQVLQWLISRLDPNMDMTAAIDSEADRVIFIRNTAHHLAVKANLRLNTKKLYTANGLAVQELLKGVTMLLQAAQSAEREIQDREEMNENLIRSKLSEFKKSRLLASEITSRGASLFDVLAQEVTLREERDFVLNRSLDLQDVEQSLKESIKSVEKDMERVTQKMENVATDESNLDTQIEKRREDMERARKRLEALKSVRPAFMDEFEKLEQELSYAYDLYVLKFRCLVYLEQQLEDIEKTELDQMRKREESVREMITSGTEASLFEEDKYGGISDSPKESDEEEEVGNGDSDGRLGGAASRRMLTGRVAVQSAARAKEPDDSLDSDIDLEGEDDASDLDSEDELELMNLASKPLKETKRPATTVKKNNDSDDEF